MLEYAAALDALHSNPGVVGSHSQPDSQSGEGPHDQPVTEIYCQVPGCGFNLTECSYYVKRHRVCQAHMKAKIVALAGENCRFCQQCGRFQPLSDFKEDRKSCDAALRAHNARRRMMHRDSSSLLQDRPRGISSRSRSRGQPSSEPEQPQDGPAVQRRTARRSSSFRSQPDPNQDLLRAVRHRTGNAGRETRSDGDQARAQGSKSPSCSLQTSEEAVQQPQGHEQQQPSTTADASGSPAAGTESCQPACWPWSATSMDAAWGVQSSSGVQPGRYELKGFQGIRSIGAAGSSRLGLSTANSTAAASGPPAAAQANTEPFNGFTPVAFDWLQQQQSQQQQQQIDSTCTLPAYCGSMGISSTPGNTQHQVTLAGWMCQHSWQGAQQMWAAGIGDACSMPVLAQPSTLQHAGSMQQQDQLLLRVLQQQQQQPQACLPLQYSSTLQQQHQQSQDGLTQQLAADTNATSYLDHSVGMQQSLLPQQQPSPLQQQQQQQQQQELEQPTCVQQEQRPSLQQQQQQQLQERIHSPEQLLQGRRHSSQQLQDPSWLDQLLLDFSAGPAPPALGALRPDAAAAPIGPLHAASSLALHGSAAGCQAGPEAAERVDLAVASAAELLPDAPEDPLADALDLVEVLLAGDPDWQLVQASSAATVSISTHPATTTIGSSTPSSSNGVLNSPSGRLSDLSLVSQGLLPGGCIAMTEAAGQAPAPALLDAAAAAAARAAEAVPLNPAAVAAGLISPSGFGKPHQYGSFFTADAAAAAAVADSSFPSSAQHRQQPQVLMLPANVLQEPVAGSMHTQTTPTSLAAGSTQAHSMPGALLTPLQAASLGIAALSDPGAAAAAAVLASSNLPAVDAQYSHAGYGSDAMVVDLDGTVPVLQLSTQLSKPQQEQPQQSELLSPVLQSSALLQQQQELAQQQLLHQQQQQQLFLHHHQQQEQLQLMLWQQQQQQQQQQQPAAMQHQLVRLSLKVHGVTPDQLPSITVQSMQSLLSRHAGNMDAIMLQPAFRQGCVQMEFDILVKPSLVADTQPLWLQRQQTAASRGDSAAAAAAGGVVHHSKASMAWSAVVDALSLCPVTAAAEAQLREALPFRLLLLTLLDLPLVGSSSTEEQHADRHSSSSRDGHKMNRPAAEGTVGSRVRSVFAQIGSCMGMWCADVDVLQEWTPGIAGRTVATDDSSSSNGVVAGSWRPQVLAAGPLCVAAGADNSAAGGGSWAAGQAWQPLLLDVAVQAGCTDGVGGDTTSSGTASSRSSSSTAGSSGSDGVESKPQLWCTRQGLFLPLASHLEAEASAGAAATAVGSLDVIVGLDGALPGLLLLQAEQLNHVSSSGSSALDQADLAEGGGIEGGEDPVPCMSSLVPVVVCPSAAMAAEAEGLLLGAVDSTHAGRLLQQLGLVLDCWTLIKQQQQWQEEQHLGLSEREQWCRALLSNQQYRNAIRSACNDWLLLATLHSMPATVACLKGVVHSLTGHATEQAAPAAGVAADATEAAVTPQPEPAAAAPEGAAEPVLAASGSATASRVGDTAVLGGQERHEAATAAAVLQGSAGVSTATCPVRDWVFEDVAALKGNSSHGSSSSTSRDVSGSSSTSRDMSGSSSKAEGMPSQGVDGTAVQRHWVAWAKQHAVLLTLLLVLALVLMLLVVAWVGQSQVQGLLLPVRIVWQFLQAASAPLAIIGMGWALACWVARQQQQQAGLQRRGVQRRAARCDAVQEASSSKAAAGGEAQGKGGAV